MNVRPFHSKTTLSLAYLVCLLVQPLIAVEASPRVQLPFNDRWRFYRGDVPGADDPAFDDSQWRVLSLPHDWSIEDAPATATNSTFKPIGPFSPDSPGGASTGYALGGTGWYRNHFELGPEANGKLVSVVFDGVYMDSDVWLNGRHLGNHPYGYTPFVYDLTPFLRGSGETNILAVRVRNLGKNSRWYSGSGIYRPVQLFLNGPIHLPTWGVAVSAPEISKDHARLKVVATIENSTDREASVLLNVWLLGAKGQLAGASEATQRIPAKGRLEVTQWAELPSPVLWSPASPHLYRARVEVSEAGTPMDEVEIPFGVREVRFSAERGLSVNGEPVQLRGGCVHHDNGPLGSAAIARAEERRVELLKANGFNAIRTSHNPPSTAFLDACDRLGMLVIDEAFDCWEQGKNPQDYHLFFKDWS